MNRKGHFSSGINNTQDYIRRGEPGDKEKLIAELSEKTGVSKDKIKLNLYYYIGSVNRYAYRQVMTLHYLYGKSIAEIKYELNQSFSNIEHKLEVGKQQIISLIEKEKDNGKNQH